MAQPTFDPVELRKAIANTEAKLKRQQDAVKVTISLLEALQRLADRK